MSVVALVEPETLLGQAFAEAMGERLPSVELKMMSSTAEEASTLTQVGDEMTLISPLDAEALETVDLVILAGNDDGLLDRIPEHVMAIWLAAGVTSGAGIPVVGGVNELPLASARLARSPHAVVVALAHVVSALESLEPQRVTASAMLPVSIHNHADGLDELFEQTRATLNFSSEIPMEVLGRHVAFNILPLPGGADLERDLCEVLARDIEASVQLVQGPTFHGLALSITLTLGERGESDEVAELLAASPVIELAGDPAATGSREVAGAEGIHVGDIEVERNGLCRLWIVLDNLTRGGALNAIDLAEHLLGR